MESVVRKLVQEEVKKALDENASSSSSSSKSVNSTETTKKRLPQVKSRLNNILTKITKKTGKIEKEMKIQVICNHKSIL